MDLDVFLTDRPGELDAHKSVDGRSEDDRRLSYAGSVVAGLVADLEVMVFEHPEHGWRNVAPGDVAYDAKHRRVFGRSHNGWHPVTSAALQQALERRLFAYRHPQAGNV